MREPQMCNIVCKLKLDAKTAKEFKEKIDDEYRVNMYGFNNFHIFSFHFSATILTSCNLPFTFRILDNLPLVVPIKRVEPDSTVYQLGFHVRLKGQYTGVCSTSFRTMFIVVNAMCFLVLTFLKYTEQGGEVFYSQPFGFYGEIS